MSDYLKNLIQKAIGFPESQKKATYQKGIVQITPAYQFYSDEFQDIFEQSKQLHSFEHEEIQSNEQKPSIENRNGVVIDKRKTVFETDLKIIKSLKNSKKHKTIPAEVEKNRKELESTKIESNIQSSDAHAADSFPKNILNNHPAKEIFSDSNVTGNMSKSVKISKIDQQKNLTDQDESKKQLDLENKFTAKDPGLKNVQKESIIKNNHSKTVIKPVSENSHQMLLEEMVNKTKRKSITSSADLSAETAQQNPEIQVNIDQIEIKAAPTRRNVSSPTFRGFDDYLLMRVYLDRQHF